jgi:TPP-dependent pyruvate/acetoin dehydrogenase alpha subunit
MAEKTQSKAPGAEIDAEGARDLYRRMRLIRTFEDTVQ